MIQTVFNRYEKKYLLSQEQYIRLRKALQPHMEEDMYGLHTICNIYYDTPDDALIRRSIDKPIYKEKLRLRSYGIPKLEDNVFLEIKKKYRGIVNKRRISMTLQEAYNYTIQGIRPREEGQILKEIDYFLRFYQTLYPKLYLAYDRVALFGKIDPGFRVTFDHNIRSRRTKVGLEHGDIGEPLLNERYYLMESKILGAAPIWFSRLLSQHCIYPTSFSKYGNIYSKNLQKKMISSETESFLEQTKNQEKNILQTV